MLIIWTFVRNICLNFRDLIAIYVLVAFDNLLSTRLQNVAPVSYVEINPSKEVNARKNHSISIEVGAKEEVYTDEHEKLLGTYVTDWTLFVDGFGTDGKRIYDCVKGKTCHQCR